MNISSVLFPTDFSECSDEALKHAITLCRSFKAQLILLHVHQAFTKEILDRFKDIPKAQTLLEQLHEEVEDLMKLYLETAEKNDIRTSVHIVWGNSVVEEIQKMAKEKTFDLIVMGTHGSNAISKVFLGKITEKVITHFPQPVLTAKKGDADKNIAKTYSRILLPFDLSVESAEALKYGIPFAESLNAEVHILHSIPFTSDLLTEHYQMPANIIEGIRQQDVHKSGKKKVNAVFSEVNCEYRKYAFKIVNGKPSDAIIKYAAENIIDLIIMRSKGHGSTVEGLIGSTTDRVVRRSRCPVLIV